MKTINQLKRVDKGINARPLHVFCIVGQVKKSSKPISNVSEGL